MLIMDRAFVKPEMCALFFSINPFSHIVMQYNSDETSFETVREKLEAEIAPVPWQDLQRPFAKGIVLYINQEIDLLTVAEKIANDDTTAVKQWVNEGVISHISDEQARQWHQDDAQLMTAIVKPWVLVQTCRS